MLDKVSEQRPGLLRRWEALTATTQIAIAFPPLGVILFLINLGPFHQPLWRSVLYGIIEGGILTGLLLVATVTERGKRRKGQSERDEDDDLLFR
jgi:hypothetical protein